MALKRRHIFHPQISFGWPEFIIGSIVAGFLLGIGWQFGATVVNHYYNRHEHDKSAVDPEGRY